MAVTQEEVQDIVGAMVTGNVEIGITVTYDDETRKLDFNDTGGDVIGPASSTDYAVVRWDGETGRLVQNSVVLIGDAGEITGVSTLVASGAVTVDDLLLYDTDASHTVTFHWNENEAGANRTLNWVMGGADRTITLSGNPTLADWFDQSVKQAATPIFADVIITGMSGVIISTTGVELSIEELDDSQASEINTGFLAWTSGAAANTYTITGADEFQIDRSFDGYIKGKKYSWAAAIKTGALTANACNWIYGKSDGTLDFATSFSHALFEDNVVLFEVMYDGANFCVVKENHAADFQTNVSLEIHDIINVVLEGVGADITRVALGAGGAAADREIKIVGADVLYDHGLSTTIPDSVGAGVTWKQHYTDGGGNWILDTAQTQILMKYNNAGVSAALGNNKFGAGRLYVSKDRIESVIPEYFTVIGDTEYNSQAGAEAGIAAGIPAATNELDSLEIAHLGYYIVKNNVAGGYITTLIIQKDTIRSSPTGAGATNQASLVSVDITNFAGSLSATDLTVQLALDTLDDHLHDTQTLEMDNINSDGGAFLFTTTGDVQFSQSIGVGTTPDRAAEFLDAANPQLRLTQADAAQYIDFQSDGGASLIVTSIANQIMKVDVTPLHNIAIGKDAGTNFTTGSFNVAIGRGTMIADTEGSNNTAIGALCFITNTTGYQNSALGVSSLYGNTTGYSNVALGVSALYTNTIGYENTSVGLASSYFNTEGHSNVALGFEALRSNTTASNNTGVGGNALRSNTTGTVNSAFGLNALYANITGDYNVGIGVNALRFNTAGNINVALGYAAGYYETGSSKLFIDNATRASEADGRVKALVYGIFAAATANQYFTVNGHLIALEDIAAPTITVNDLLLYDTNASHTVTLHWNEDEAAANRTLNLVMGGADRTITLSGDPTLADWFDQAVKAASSPTFGGMAMTGYIDWTEIAAPGNPAANVGRMYSKDDGGLTKPYWRDSAGTESLMLGAGATGVTAAAVIADHTLTRGDGGARGIQDSGWVLGDDDVLVAADNLNMNDKDIINLRDILPYDETLNVTFATSNDATAYIKNTGGATPDFGHADIDNKSAFHTAYWRLEETGAANRVDDVDAHDLVPTNAPGTRAGISNNACDFISGSSQYVSVAHHADLSADTGFIVSFWVETDDIGTNRMLWAKGAAPYCYRTNVNTTICFLLQSDSANKFATAADDLNPGINHVVSMACDGFIRIYVNGAEVAAPVAYDNTIKQNADPFYLGTWSFLSLYHDGGIDEVSYWKNPTFTDQAERDAFVVALYNGGTGRFFATHVGAANLDVADFLYLSNTGLQMADTDDSHNLNIKWNENEAAADRTLNLVLGGADRSLTIDGDGVVSEWNTAYGWGDHAGLYLLNSIIDAAGDIVYGSADDTFARLAKGNDGEVLTLAGGLPSWAVGGGDVIGPAGATDHAVARWDTATGKLLQDSVVIIDDAGAVTGVTTLVASGAITADDLLLYDTNASHTLTMHWNEDEAGANRTLNIIMGGADRTLDFTTFGDVTAAAVITDHSLVRGDGGAKGIQDSGGYISDAGHFSLGATPAADSRFYMLDTVNTATTHWSARFISSKTAGATDFTHPFLGTSFYTELDQTGGNVGDMYGIASTAQVTDGNVGDSGGGEERDFFGASFVARVAAAGRVYGDVVGLRAYVDNDGTVDGTVYTILMDDVLGSNVDYGLYQTGTSPNVLNGLLGLGKIPAGNGPLDIDFATEDLEFIDAGSAGATEQDWIEVNVGGNQGFIRVHAAI